MRKQFIPAQRRERILDYLNLHKIVRSSELSNLLNVSEATVRRDLAWMENEGILNRTHGGAVLSESFQFEPEYTLRAKRQVQEKRDIGRLAADMINDGDIVFVNSGTTTSQLIHNIRPNADITIVTNNLSAALEINESSFELILVGGVLQPKLNSVAGMFAVDNLNQIYADQAFIGVDGISINQGYTVPSLAEAEIVRMMFEQTKGPVTVLADITKWESVSNFVVADIDQVNRIITDDELGPIAREALADFQVEVIYLATDLNLP
jgi:DeoR family transcriptional regulator of aga operon/DeoR family fructose operon transcriptional repressor